MLTAYANHMMANAPMLLADSTMKGIFGGLALFAVKQTSLYSILPALIQATSPATLAMAMGAGALLKHSLHILVVSATDGVVWRTSEGVFPEIGPIQSDDQGYLTAVMKPSNRLVLCICFIATLSLQSFILFGAASLATMGTTFVLSGVIHHAEFLLLIDEINKPIFGAACDLIETYEAS